MGFQKAFVEVKVLIEDFKNNKTYYISSNYAEAQVRQDFIDKFFTLLGWDVAHNFQKNPFEQEVKVEKPQRQEGMQSQKRADYAFALAPNFKQTQFFVEAKKPSRILRKNRDDYFQTAKYGWNSQTGISILTDFEELVLIDCRFKPDFETILDNEIKYYDYQDFLDEEKFAEIYFLFSKEAVSEGKLRTYIDQLPKPKVSGKQLKLFAGKYKAIDEDFLEYIDEIRKNLALAFYHNNPALEDYELTEATQRTIDRLVFMRFLEDKQIEPDDVMHHIAIAQHPWQKFVETCKRFDAKYNGIIFKKHFIDDDFQGANEELFRNICQDLDHTNSPYDFNYFPIHILGNIYERFLGKIIIIENGKASIELKPEVRKAGGVFYTPKYIVDYIVANTIGKLIAGKTPKQISTLTFADIACGSGSFLIGVYEFLLDYHLKYYNEKPAEAKKEACIFDPESQIFVLSIKQKQEILTNNVFGVDIDQQATEVTQVSLFLKLLEDETMATANDMNVLFSEKILPDLSGNIKCGNSLIGWEIMDGVLEFGQKELRKLNPFSFEEAFPKVFRNGGFDAIVGNPPYVKEYTDKSIFESVKKGKLKKYYQGKMDFWYFFVCSGIDMLVKDGLLGYIVPNNWVSNSGASILRNKVISDSKIISLIDFGGFMVFDDASIQTMIMLLEKNFNTNNYQFNNWTFNNLKLKNVEVQREIFEQTNEVSVLEFPTIIRENFRDKFLKFSNFEIESVLNKILNAKNFELDSKKEVAQGIVAAPDKYFLINKNHLNDYNQNEKLFLKPFYTGTKRYFCETSETCIFYISNQNFSGKNISDYPNIKNHFLKFETELTEAKIRFGTPNKPYFYLHRERLEKFFSNIPKIISPSRSFENQFFYTEKEFYVSRAANVIISERINLKYLIGILNSKLIFFWLKNKGKLLGNLLQVDKEPLLQIPIHKSENQNLHDDLVKLVDQILKAKEEEQHAKTDMDKTLAKRRCDNLDFRINEIVYQLYNLSAEEIALVEGNS